ncbi:MAG: hypothetical protein WBZ36_16595 [Candidatus Nitrosopolaris sp.]
MRNRRSNISYPRRSYERIEDNPVYQAAAMSNGLDLMLDITNPVGFCCI